MREIDVAAGENDAELGFGAVATSGEIECGDCAGFQEWGDCYRGRRLNHDFEAFPNEAHRVDDFGFRDAEDSGEVFAEDGKGARRERGAEAVSDGVGGVDGLQRAGS